MSLTLGEKLREAREARGISLSEVAEQTRISPLYIESIENDDFRNLPGGIFNKGFVKSFAKYVGVPEQEALADYAKLIQATEDNPEPDLKAYRPEVLTDDRSGSSMVPTVIVAVIILAAMTGGILFLVNYLRRPSEPVAVANTKANTAANANVNDTAPANTNTSPAGSADMASLSVELKASNSITVMATVDGEPPKRNNLVAGSVLALTPKESLTLNYLRWNAQNIQLSMNGKAITLPSAPLDPKDRDRIVFTISKENLAQILSTGSITGEAAPPPDANVNANLAPTNTATPVAPRTTPPTAKPANTAANAATNVVPKPAANTRPTANTTMMTSKTPKP